MGKLDNKVAVITGAAGGIGRAAAKLFAQEGARLMLVDLDEANLLSMVEEIGSDQASYVTADVSNVNDVKNYIDKTLSIFKKIDITLLNASLYRCLSKLDVTLAWIFSNLAISSLQYSRFSNVLKALSSGNL